MPDLICPTCGHRTVAGPSHCPTCGTSLAGAPIAPPLPITPPRPVTIADIDVPFGSLVNLILKFWLASIPALLIIGFFLVLAGAAIGSCAVALPF